MFNLTTYPFHLLSKYTTKKINTGELFSPQFLQYKRLLIEGAVYLSLKRILCGYKYQFIEHSHELQNV